MPSTLPAADVPGRISDIAASALMHNEAAIERELEGCTDEDREADLLNELGFIRAIMAHL